MALPILPSGAIRLMRMGWSDVRMARCLAKPLLQGQRGRGRPDFRAIDHENVGVAAVLLPFSCALRETVERGVVITGGDILVHPLQAGVSEIRRIGLDG